ncbi:hypothetical protein ACFXB3_11245 [Streptomyces sp. NPDC059447]|uniref:hypothetical protein n=1 Tax=Streptomyces sp. NPDC059447 TaxID=3346834 RepID=UPI00367ABD7A
MSLFDSVDHYYARYRPRLPDQVVQFPAREPTGAATPRLLDLGAGTTNTYREPGRRHEPDLADSPFSDIAEHRIAFTRAWKPRSVPGYLRSTSFTRPDLFTDHTGFEERAHALLLEHVRDGALNEDGAFTVLLAHLPGVAR